jgi:hypothetical protein
MFDPGQSPARAVPVETVVPVVVVVVAGTSVALLLAGPATGTEDVCPPIGARGVLDAAALLVEQ